MDFQSLLQGYNNKEIDYPDVVSAMSGLSKTSIKQDGVVYTPLDIVQRMIEMAAPFPHMIILEPSVGHGIFLYGLLEYSRSWNFSSTQTRDWFMDNIRAIDLNHKTVEETRLLLCAYFKREHQLTIAPEDFTNIQQGDGLLSRNRFDLIIGNPPYVRTKNIDKQYLDYIRKSFTSCQKGNIDLFYAFVEHAHQYGDQVCLIIPNSILANVSAKRLRDIIVPRLTHLIDFKDKKVFDGIGTYTCIIHLTNETSSYLSGHSFDQPLQSITKEASSNSSQKTFDVLSGIATLADSIYIIEKKDDIYFANLNGNLIEVESGCVVPFIKITKQQTDEFSNVKYLIFPYRNNTIMSEDQFQEQYPKAYNYLVEQKSRLLQRDKGKTARYEAWYAYGRKQGFKPFDGKVLLVPSMIGGKSQPITVDVSDLVNRYGGVLFSSGYVIPVNDDNEILCQFITSDKFSEWLIRNGKPFPGGFFGITATQIRNITL